MAHEEPNAHHQVPYDPLVDVTNSARGSPLPTPAAEFGAPNPGFLSGTYNSDSAASSTGNFRGSNYGSIAPLQRNSSNLPPGAAGWRDEDFADQNNVEKDVLYAAPRTKSKRKLFWIAGLVCAAILLIAIVVPVVYFVAIKKHGGSGNGGGSGSAHNGGGTTTGANGNHQQSNFATWGGDGSTVTKDDGSTFIYNNTLGGIWVFDPQNPINNSARAQSYSPPLSEQWPWGQQLIYGYVFLLSSYGLVADFTAASISAVGSSSNHSFLQLSTNHFTPTQSTNGPSPRSSNNVMVISM
jgi:glucan 1,3-beta-glucosidase